MSKKKTPIHFYEYLPNPNCVINVIEMEPPNNPDKHYFFGATHLKKDIQREFCKGMFLKQVIGKELTEEEIKAIKKQNKERKHQYA